MFRTTLLLAVFTTGLFTFSSGAINYRPYVSTQLAKAIMQSNQVLPDDDVKEICDGSGYITHGDGHRTPCPGCKACKPNGDMGEDSGDDRLVADPPANLMIYHLGASWCSPCQQLKSQTWGNARVKQFMKDKGVKIHYFDFDTPDHREFFNFYKVSSFPTVVFVERDDLNNPERTVVGFFDANTALRFLEEELDD